MYKDDFVLSKCCKWNCGELSAGEIIS